MPRQCPACLTRSDARLCPACGVATFRFEGIDVVAASRLEAGDVVCERYRVVRPIGRGGMGAVYEARHTATGQPVALKLLAMQPADGQEVFLRFAREARVTASLRHANTVRLYDFGQAESGALFMAMELLDGMSLQALITARLALRKALRDGEALTIGIEILRSLGEAHAAGLVHRDLKPDNIMLAHHGNDAPFLKVLDFGIARSTEARVTGTSRLVGTPLYMSPEQCLGEALDGRSDLYALGVVLYLLVSGVTPFGGDIVSVIRGHCDKPAPDVRLAARSPVSDAFAEVVRRALCKAPAERFADAAEMREALEVCLPADAPRSLVWLKPELVARVPLEAPAPAPLPTVPSDLQLAELAPTMEQRPSRRAIPVIGVVPPAALTYAQPAAVAAPAEPVAAVQAPAPAPSAPRNLPIQVWLAAVAVAIVAAAVALAGKDGPAVVAPAPAQAAPVAADPAIPAAPRQAAPASEPRPAALALAAPATAAAPAPPAVPAPPATAATEAPSPGSAPASNPEPRTRGPRRTARPAPQPEPGKAQKFEEIR